jgi:hypothetical protein
LQKSDSDGDTSALGLSLEIYLQGIELIPLEHPSRLAALENLTDYQLRRYQQLRIKNDLSQTEAILKETHQLDYFKHPDSLSHMIIYAHVKLTIFNL